MTEENVLRISSGKEMQWVFMNRATAERLGDGDTRKNLTLISWQPQIISSEFPAFSYIDEISSQ